MKTSNGRGLAVIEADLHAALKVEASSVITIGKLLIEAKAAVKHGEWLPWLAANFADSDETARSYMNAARLAAKFQRIWNLPLRLTSLSELAGTDLPDDAMETLLTTLAGEPREGKWIACDRVHNLIFEAEFRAQSDPMVQFEADAEADAEARALLDNPPDDVPIAPEEPAKTVPAPAQTEPIELTEFEQAVDTLLRVRSKPLRHFDGGMHSLDDLQQVVEFIRLVAQRRDPDDPETSAEKRKAEYAAREAVTAAELDQF